MTFTLRSLTADEISALDQVPPLTGAPLGWPTPSLFVPLGQWLDALYGRASGSVPGPGAFTTLGVVGPMTVGAAGSSFAMNGLRSVTGVATDSATVINSSNTLTGVQPVLTLTNNGTKLADFAPSGLLNLVGNLTFTKEANHTVGLVDATTVGGSNGGLSFRNGASGPADATTPGGAGNYAQVVGGVGGAGSAAQVAGVGGEAKLIGGAAGNAGAAGGAAGGPAVVDAGAGTGAGANGDVYVGASSAVNVNISRSSGKVGFFGVTAVVRPGAYTQTYSTATRTNPAALTDSTTGAASGTLAAITSAANAGSADVGPVKDALASLAAKVKALQELLNALIDDGQALGLAQ